MRRTALSVVAAALGLALVTALGAPTPACLAVPVAIAAGMVLAGRRAQRRAAARRSADLRAALPDALDLLAAVVDGGAAPSAALGHVCRAVGDPLAGALDGVLAGAADGVGSRIAAVDPALRPLGSLLRQSEDLGVPIAASLRLLAVDARLRQRAELRERAAAAAPRMLLVVGTLLAPASLLVVIGGQVLALRESAGGLLA